MQQDIQALHLFSDEEGSSPFRNAAKQFTEPCDPIFYNGLISGVKPGGKLVYLGDLMDRYPNEIKLMLNMIAIHDRDSNQITLIAGNRDVNKMRLKDELRILCDLTTVTSKTQLVELANTIALQERIQFGTYDASRFDTWGNNKAEHVLSSDPVLRLHACVTVMMGVKTPKQTIVTKITEAENEGFFVSKQLKDDRSKAVFVCLLYTILAGGYAIPSGADPDFQQYFGLYCKFLSKCKIMSIETVGNARVLVAHAGVPDLISNPIGYNKKSTGLAPSAHSVQQVIDAINQDFTKHVTEFFKDPSATNIDLLNYYVGLSGPPTELGPHEHFLYKLSPIVSSNLRDRTKHKSMYAGGDHTQIDYTQPIYATLDNDAPDKTLLNYVVFGHTPQGNAPTVWANNGTVFAAIDVSNSNDDPSPDYSTYAVMTIRSATRMVVRGQYSNVNSKTAKTYKNTLADYQRNPTRTLDGRDYDFRYPNVFTHTHFPVIFHKGDALPFQILEYADMIARPATILSQNSMQANSIVCTFSDNTFTESDKSLTVIHHERQSATKPQRTAFSISQGVVGAQKQLTRRNEYPISEINDAIVNRSQLTHVYLYGDIEKDGLKALGSRIIQYFNSRHKQRVIVRCVDSVVQTGGNGNSYSWLFIAQGVAITVACAVIGTLGS